ncbi:hypothetical protein [Paenibacillus pseudetheri]|uniref:hypothetical protein n=1 Tax=Paenibacillus pseudetheri TaxID=2897682 RepID=UPI001F15F5D1|nr:hypothetical protein [Paenibacillus pseudetheri]
MTKEDIVKAIGTPPEQIAKAGKKISAGNLKHVDDAIASVHCFHFNDRNIPPFFESSLTIVSLCLWKIMEVKTNGKNSLQ